MLLQLYIRKAQHDIKGKIQNSFINREQILEKAKPHPIGYINDWGEMKMPDGSWKYVGKKGHSHEAAKELIKQGYSLGQKSVEKTKTKLIHYSELDTNSAKFAGGSGGAYIMTDKSGGNKVIIKKEEVGEEGMKNSKQHLISEQLTDELYTVLGINSSESEIQELKGGKIVKVSKFIEGRNLNSLFSDPQSFEIVREELKKGFVADCLFLNWDVIGLEYDNIIVDSNLQPHRIDNGGSLLYRAKSGFKNESVLTTEVTEIDSLRSSRSASGSTIFGDITDEQIRSQVEDIVGKKDRVIETIQKSKLENKEYVSKLISSRIDWLNEKWL